MYEFGKFTEVIKQDISTFLYQFNNVDYKIHNKKTISLNNEERNHLLVDDNSDNCNIPSFDLDFLYDKYCKGYSIEKIVASVSDVYIKSIDKNKLYSVSKIYNRDFILNNARPCIINLKNNEDFLIKNNIVYFQYGNIALFFKYTLGSEYGMRFSDRLDTIDIKYDTINALGISCEELFEQSFINSKKYCETVLVTDSINKDFNNSLDLSSVNISNFLYLFTNNERIFGAATMFHREFLDFVCDKHENDKLVIIPSSVHEVLITPASEVSSLEFVNNIIGKMNKSLTNKEVLDDGVYIYDKALSQIYTVDNSDNKTIFAEFDDDKLLLDGSYAIRPKLL